MTNLRAHNVENYDNAKRLQLWLRPKGSSDDKEWQTAGSVKGVTIEPKSVTLAHFANYLGQRAKDKEITTQRELSINFQFEEFNIDNLKLAFGYGFGAAEAGSKDKPYDRTEKNSGAGAVIDLGKTSIKNLQVRSVSLEDPVTYVLDDLDVDTTDDTAGNSFNNTTDPVVIVAASYPGTPTAVGSFIKIQSEILKVTAFSGGNITLARAQLGTTAATHANGVSIFKTDGGDYVANLTTGKVGVQAGGDLDDVDVTQMHLQFDKAVNVHKFEMFPGDPIECEAKLMLGDEFLGPWEGAILKNNGAITLGDGSDWREVPMTLEITVDAEGTFGDGAKIDEGQDD